MDYQGYVDCCAAPCAVLSVEITGADTYGEIRIVCSNQRYKDIMGPAYYDGMPYWELVPKDVKFEDFCYRSAVLKQHMHAYVETKALDCWTDQMMIPVASDRDDMGYCQFVFEFTKEADASRMAAVSLDTASEVIQAAITLLKDNDFKDNVREVLGQILDVSQGFSSRIVLIDDEREETFTFCEEFREGSEYQKGEDDADIPYETVKSWENMIGVSNAVIVKNEHEMGVLEQRNPEWVKQMRHFMVESLVLIPLRRGSTVIGYLYVVNFDVEKAVQVKELVELMSFFLGSEISNYLLMTRLERLSSVDALTGLFNRNAMLRRMKELTHERKPVPFGVANIDLNGLKLMNDHSGHDAGDKLLVEAAEILKKVFYDDDLYRTGGDEFIVIATDIAQDVFERKVNRLHADAQKNADVSFAIGSCWSDGTDDMREVFREADARMYEDKQAYYAEHPELRRF